MRSCYPSFSCGRRGLSTIPPNDLSSVILTKFKNYTTDDYSTVDDDGMSVPPLACAFAKMPQHQHILSVVDEDGYLVLYNTHKTARHAIIKTWQIHSNAVFDLEWLSQEDKILSGSGDQTIMLHDIPTGSKLETFCGHKSSIKSISCRMDDDAVFASGSRDGHIMIWDKRIYHKNNVVPPVDTISHAHTLGCGKKRTTRNAGLSRRAPAAMSTIQQSVTSVLFQNANYLISAGAVDGCLKVWDVRKTYKVSKESSPVHVFHYPGTSTRIRGYSSLAMDSYGLRLFASCTDDRIYEFDIHNYVDKPVNTYGGHKNSTFYVKSAVSPDDQYLLSGSSDDNAYIWQINKPNSSPIVLKGNTAEVTSVAWCPNDLTKLVTLSDDAKTKVWRVHCREQDKNKLPPFIGSASKFSKETGTSTSADAVPPVAPATPSTSSSSPTTDKLKSLAKMSSPTLTKSPSLLMWLKRKQSSDSVENPTTSKLSKVETSNDTSVLEVGGKRLLEDSEHETLAKKIKLDPNCDTLPEDGASEQSINKDSSNGSSDSSKSLLIKNTSLPPIKPQVLKSPTNSPLKRRRSDDLSENMPTLSPRVLFKFFQGQNSPKRQCLTKLNSNSPQLKDGSPSAKSLLFKDNDIKSDGKDKDCSNDSTTKPLTNPFASEQTGSTFVTPSKLSRVDLSEFESPTHNLPNLVMDELAGRSPTTAPRPSVNTTPKQNWLTKLRQAKMKGFPESPVLEKSPEGRKGRPSPRVKKGMKTLDKYFRNTDE